MVPRISPPSKPQRPLSAYNLFFRLERDRILAGQQSNVTAFDPFATASHARAAKISAEDVAKISDEKRYGVVRRQDRKKHGKIGFAELAKLIAKKWKNISESERWLLEERARVEKRKHKQLMKEYAKKLLEYNKQIQNHEELNVGHTVDGTEVVPKNVPPRQTTRFIPCANEGRRLPLVHGEEVFQCKGQVKQSIIGNHSEHFRQEHAQQQQMYMMKQEQQQQQMQQQMYVVEKQQKDEAFMFQQNKSCMIQQHGDLEYTCFDVRDSMRNDVFFVGDSGTLPNMTSPALQCTSQQAPHYQNQPIPFSGTEIVHQHQHMPCLYRWDSVADCGYGSTNNYFETGHPPMNQTTDNTASCMTMMIQDQTNFGYVSPLSHCEPVTYDVNHDTPIQMMHLH